MAWSTDFKHIPFGPKTWAAGIVVAGLLISTVLGWSSYFYGNLADRLLEQPDVPLMFFGVLMFAGAMIVLRWLATLVFRWRGKSIHRPAPGTWSFAWITVQLACLVAILALGLVTLVALVLGSPERMFQGFLSAVIGSGLLFLVGGAIREIGRWVSIFRQ